jgi:hypothetical protein
MENDAMPSPDCYRDLGAIGARIDEIEKARMERDAAVETARAERAAQMESALSSLNRKMDAINNERQRLIGVIWAVRVLFGGVGAVAVYLATNGVPGWIKRALQ